MPFTEQWFDGDQAELIARLAASAPEGALVEIGCWEGFSTTHIARAVAPRTLYAVDHWQGNLDEGAGHPSVEAARERDVYATFLANVAELTAGNVIPIRADWREALENPALARVAFAHIDAAHDYASVRDTLAAVAPRLVPGAILCGDDFRSAHMGRDDLGGGVERAVVAFCVARGLDLYTQYNAWWTVLPA